MKLLSNTLSFTTSRTESRPYLPSDLEAWLEANRKRPKALKRWDTKPLPGHQISAETFLEMRDRHQRGIGEDRHYVYGTFLKETGELIGCIDFFVICRDDRQAANIGYTFCRRFRGRGFAREAVSGAFTHGFSVLGFQRIEASIDPENERSIALCRKIGLEYEGFKREYLFEDPEWIDQEVFFGNPRHFGLRSRPPRTE